MEEGYGGLRTVGVGRPGELAIPEPTEERPIRYRIALQQGQQRDEGGVEREQHLTPHPDDGGDQRQRLEV